MQHLPLNPLILDVKLLVREPYFLKLTKRKLTEERHTYRLKTSRV